MDVHGNFKMSVVILLGLCRKFGFAVRAEDGQEVYDPSQPENGLSMNLDNLLDSISHTLLAWVRSRRVYEIIRILMLEKVVKHVGTVKRHIRKKNIQVRTLFFSLFSCVLFA